VDPLIFDVVVPYLYVEIQLSQLFIFLLEFGLRIGYFSYFEEDLFYSLGVDCWQNLGVEFVDVSLH
jgi:hypothetical protein